MESTAQVATLVFLSHLVASVLAQDIVLNLGVREESPPDIFVGNILAESGLELTQPQFLLLTEGNQHAGYFTIGESDGVLTTQQIIDRDSEIFCPGQVDCVVELSIIVQGPELFKVIQVNVNIEDQNDKIPTFQESPAQRSIPENMPVGSSFSIPSAQDLDSPEFGIVEYRMVSGSSETFELRVVDGDLYLELKTEIDREVKDAYRFVISAIDGGPERNSGILNLDVLLLDVNDNPPQFEYDNYAIDIPENFEMDTVVVTVRASDQDTGANGEIVYGLGGQTTADYGDLFSVGETTGEVILRGTLDFESQKSYVLVVTAKEKLIESLAAEAKVTVTVLDINDNSPQTTVSSLSATGRIEVPENMVPGQNAIAYISVRDPDTGRGSEFDCNLETTDFSLEEGTASSYRLFSAVEFDREVNSFADVDFICTDQGVPRLSSTTTIRVFIKDENDNDPEFEQDSYRVEVPENSPEGTGLTQVMAIDEDAGANGQVTYHLASDLNDYVSLDPITGNLTARKPFNREQLAELQLLVQAKDQGDSPRSATVIVTIAIQDVNDEAPEFTVSQYNFSVSENASAGALVGQVSAWDKDLFPNNEFEFSFPYGLQSTEEFAIDNASGSITTRVTLDREEKKIYHLVLLAVDKHNQELRSSVPVVIHITDVNDHHPTIAFPSIYNNTIHIPNDLAVGDHVTRIEASDPDSGQGATLTYSIRAGNEATVFRIDSASGTIMVNRDLDSYTEKLFLLHIRVQDQGHPPRAVESVLNIVVNKSLSRGSPDGDDSTTDQNLIIVLCVAIASSIIIFILVLAIVIVCHQDKKQKKKKKYLAALLKDSSANTVQDSQGMHTDCCSSDSGSSVKKEVSFSNDVELADEMPYMQRNEHWVRYILYKSLNGPTYRRYCHVQ